MPVGGLLVAFISILTSSPCIDPLAIDELDEEDVRYRGRLEAVIVAAAAAAAAAPVVLPAVPVGANEEEEVSAVAAALAEGLCMACVGSEQKLFDEIEEERPVSPDDHLERRLKTLVLTYDTPRHLDQPSTFPIHYPIEVLSSF